MQNYRQWFMATATVCIAAVLASPVAAQKKYDPGASDREIKIGNTIPYSGPASAYGEIGKAQAAYFRRINDEGGVNGRKINFISYDDAYSPPKTVEQVRRLVESDEVLALVQTLGTATNSAIMAPVPGPSWKPWAEKPNWWNTPSDVRLGPTTGMSSGMRASMPAQARTMVAARIAGKSSHTVRALVRKRLVPWIQKRRCVSRRRVLFCGATRRTGPRRIRRAGTRVR